MNQFGGEWTRIKIEMIVEYAKAYLTIMNKYPQFKTLYFDGFAGSGEIYNESDSDLETIKGSAIRILEIDSPKSFDMYYFVELNETNKQQLEISIIKNFPHISNRYVVEGDCNDKVISMSNFLRKNSNYRALVFIDPYGMDVNWSSVEALDHVGVDLWILVPTGIGVNRLLKNDMMISDAWLSKLQKFLGLNSTNILDHFYKERKTPTLFGDETIVEKERNAIKKAGELYRNRLSEIFSYVSELFELKNSTGSVMYHFIFASNNKYAVNIANDIINKYKH